MPSSQSVRRAAAVAAAPLALAVSGCSAITSTADAGATVTATDTTCVLSTTEFTAGVNTVSITNEGSKVTEFEVVTESGQIVSERENIGPGLTVAFTFEVAAGNYRAACLPGQVGDGIATAITVSGEGGTTVTKDARLTAAVEDYRTYVQEQADAGLPVLEEFVAAVKDGDVDQAQELYPLSRQSWERVEPVAESFGDLDPRMDAREADLSEGDTWTGWHRIEKAIFHDGTTDGMSEVADQLLADYKTFQSQVPDAVITATGVANGAKALLDEVATGKITGEEDIWSGTDLWDFKANVEGAEKAYSLVREVVGENDPALQSEIDAAFEALDAELALYEEGDGYVDYATVTETQRKALSTAVDALGEPLSQLAAVVANTSTSATSTASASASAS